MTFIANGSPFFKIKVDLCLDKTKIYFLFLRYLFRRYLSNNRYKLVKSYQMTNAQQITAFKAVNAFHSCILIDKILNGLWYALQQWILKYRNKQIHSKIEDLWKRVTVYRLFGKGFKHVLYFIEYD